MSNSIIRGGTTMTLMLSWLKYILIKHTTNTVIYSVVPMQKCVPLTPVVTMLFLSSCFGILLEVKHLCRLTSRSKPGALHVQSTYLVHVWLRCIRTGVLRALSGYVEKFDSHKSLFMWTFRYPLRTGLSTVNQSDKTCLACVRKHHLSLAN